MQKFRQHPILILLIINMVVGLLTFRNYGLSWDEPLYYEYGQASRYAYSISARLDGTFDIEKSFGASAADHVTRGPAYLLIAGVFENALEFLGLDLASAWHLTNFLTFQVGLIFFYLLIRRWLEVWPAVVSTAFFATQPVLWNHAFINPKDIPFAVFFLISVYLGFRMVDGWGQAPQNNNVIITSTILPGILLGLTTDIRFLGPYAGLLIFIFFLSTKNWKLLWGFLPYSLVALATIYIFWPFLWPDAIERFIFVLQAMGAASSNLKILFMGNLYPAYDLPRRYFPVMLAYTLTEPAWPLFIIGTIIALKKAFRESRDRARLLVILFWFGFVISSLIFLNPPNSDGYRHYLFMLPPVFIFSGFAINEIFVRINNNLVRTLILIALLAPAVIANIALHPYQYAYYNTFAGGTRNAFRQFETDYWLTCYKEAVQGFDQQDVQLFVKREPYIAEYYANENITIRDYRTEFNEIRSGDFVLVNTRANEDINTFKNDPVVLTIQRAGAVFCVIKQVP